MKRANGYFEAFVNEGAYRASSTDRDLIRRVTEIVRGEVPGSQVRWAGSQRKGTAIAGSDLDLCVESSEPVTESRRRSIREALARGLGRPARILSHAVRMPAHGGAPKVDIAFATAAFGSRPLPDPVPFHNQRARQASARALKLWARGGGLPHLPGWAVEALVVHLDPNPGERLPLEVFLRIIQWLDERATPAAVEAVLRPAAFPSWVEGWSAKLPGRLQAFRGQSRALRKRKPGPEHWSSAADVEQWLLQ